MSRVAVVTGSNKGIGFAIVKRLCEDFDGVVYLTSRSEHLGAAAVGKLKEQGLRPEYHQLDVTDRQSITKFRDHLQNKHGSIDILINNAGYASGYGNDSFEECKKVIDINYRGVLNVQEIIYPLIRRNGRVINVSSDCGHLSNVRNEEWIERLSKQDLNIEDVNEFVDWFLESKKNGTFKTSDFVEDGHIVAYRVSKVALCALTLIQQKELESRDISVNSLHPGFVRTDMTMKIGFCTADEAAETPVYLALHAPQSLRGAYVWHDGTTRDWHDHENALFFTLAFARSWLLTSLIANVKDYFAAWLSYLLDKLKRKPIANGAR
ncbi:unnamed protein product [Leptosia nina]|uniref:carbonyl reductase (NADPH) n=1 Tax=Leptosia nina TaxID=320188 RepID=A0AAV1JRH3_9NEOP